MAKHGAKLALVGVEKRYGEITALHPTDLVVELGEFFSLIGPSGSGKTTLLGTVAGFTPPSSGRIEIDGQDIAMLPPYRRNIGMVFQNYALFPHMSVFDNVAFPLRLRRLPDNDVARSVTRMLSAVRLPDVGRRRPSELSGGQQQRIALARAAVYEPRILLMDEPLGALDKNLREEMQFEIKAFHRHIDATVVYVTHDQDEATAMSDRIAIMNHGRIVQCGAPRDLYEHPCNAFAASFLGSANLFPVAGGGEATRGAVRVRLADGTELKAVASSNATEGSSPWMICVRPESIRIGPTGTLSVGDDANLLEGRVTDAVYTAGTFRYLVDVGAGVSVAVRLPAVRQSPMLQCNQPVTLAWPASATLLIPKD
jgi:putative spermidine/putrescine transport system ATP-binding protein